MGEVSKEYYAKAAGEVASGNLDSALYVKALALSDGEESKARALYIKLRAEELRAEHVKEKRIHTAASIAGGVAGVAVGTAQATTHVVKNIPFDGIGKVLLQLILWGIGIFIAIILAFGLLHKIVQSYVYAGTEKTSSGDGAYGQRDQVTSATPIDQNRQYDQMRRNSPDIAAKHEVVGGHQGVTDDADRRQACYAQYERTVARVPQDAPLSEFARVNDRAQERLNACWKR